MASHSQLRAEENVRRELSAIIPELKDPRITGMISIVDLKLSPDFSHCTVYISSLEGLEHAKEAVEGLESAAGYIRRQVSSRLDLRRIPAFHFIADDGIAYSANIGKIMQDLKKEEQKKNQRNEQTDES